MTIEISVKRQKSQKDKPYIEKYTYEGDGNLTVADWLTEVNLKEAAKDRIAWECGCLEEKCGACAILINGYPSLACSMFVKDAVKKGTILLEPFSKFPLVKDLIVDRTSMFNTLRDMKIWMEEKNDVAEKNQDKELQYKAGQCLQCGCCLEVCPNFLAKERFAGASVLGVTYKSIEQNATDKHRNEMINEYKDKFFSYCGQSLSCQSVCPKRLPIDKLQVRINNYSKHKNNR